MRMTSRRGFAALMVSALPVGGALAACGSESTGASATPGTSAPHGGPSTPTAARTTPTRTAAPTPTSTPTARTVVAARPAMEVLNDYPWPGINTHITSETTGLGATGRTWGMVYGGCVSYAAWKIYEDNGGKQRPPKTPDPGWFPGDGLAKSPVRSSWGGAATWGPAVRSAGFPVNSVPRVGAFALWPVSNTFPLGFVAYITAVNPDGSIDTAQYNLHRNATFSTAHIRPAGGLDDYPGQTPVRVPWPESFLHISADS